jgi:hypothetical protein
MEKSFKKYKKEFITKTSPSCMAWQSAYDSLWEPKTISRVSTEKLGELFVNLDRELVGGVSRQLLN